MGFLKLQLVVSYEKKLETLKTFQKMRFLNSVTVPKNVKGGNGPFGIPTDTLGSQRTLWDFLTYILLQNIETNEGGPFGAIQKISKKSRIVPKKVGG